jgi:transcriptional regulator with XRE-family HTH domain
MITNERQHRITKAQIRRFEVALAHAVEEQPVAGLHPRLHQAMIDGLRSQRDDLREEVGEYEALREGKIKRRVLRSLLDLPNVLIEARIVCRLTQKELGKRLGVAEQQVQRYEKTRYAGVSIERLQEVADALGINLKKTVEYGVRAPAKTGGRMPARAARRRRPDPTYVGSSASRSSGGRLSKGKKTSSATSRGGEQVAGKKTGKAAASAAGKTLGSRSAGKTVKRAAASDLAQVQNQKVTGKKAASVAGKTLASKSASKTAKRAAASDLSQAVRKKR